MLILDADQVAEITGGKVVGADGRSYAGGDVWRALIFLSEANTFFCRLQAEGAGGEAAGFDGHGTVGSVIRRNLQQ